MWAKRINDIIPSVKSHDRENRMRIPDNYTEPHLPNMTLSDNDYNKYTHDAVKYVEDKFTHNHGNTTSEFVYPIDRKSALKWLDEFIAQKLSKFGDYQDFIIKGTNWLNHSILSSSINIGLLNPSDILEKLKSSTVKAKIPMNSYEGYIRQLYWREYQRICYIYLSEIFKESNYFDNHGKLSNEWYNGKLDCPPVDDAIIDGFNTGYLHHIRRLMVVGNYMMLNRISPHEGFKWFMEFSVDSYEWVMYQNVYDMVFCCTGGKTMRKPYISSSSYILKMSDYQKGEWCDKWSKLYHKFLSDNKAKMQKFRYYFGGKSG
jgi:deoxyribodipyrimidine photolyase-related protein